MIELFIEIGTEEIPARFLKDAQAALQDGIKKLLGNIKHGEIIGFSTPRRLAVAVTDVAPARAATEKLVTGPGAAIAFKDGAAGGTPSPAGEAFAKKNGVTPAALYVHDTPKGPVAALKKIEGGETTATIVAAGLEGLVLGIPFKKTMRWSGTTKFARPIQYVCAKIGSPETGWERIDTLVAGLFTTETSRGHFLHFPEPFSFGDHRSYLTELRQRCVLADPGERKGHILHQLRQALENLGATQDGAVEIDAELLDEVSNLVEWPKVIVGQFDPTLLELPARLLVESMKKHQRYFPVFKNGQLTSQFLVVSNNPFGDAELIAEGNARVLAARFYDARFFYAEDCKNNLETHALRLSGMTWIRGLGTMADRQADVAAVALSLADRFGADEARVARAGSLCKADLTTQMVGEFPELQGHVGRLLASRQGEEIEVAIAIEEHYLPRFAGDYLPQSPVGRTLALAERLSLLCRCFAAGIKPSAGADPQGLRRAAQGALQILLDTGLRTDVRTLVALIVPQKPELIEEIAVFIQTRLKALLASEGHPTDIIEAVIAASGMDLVHDAARVRALSALAAEGSFGPIRITFKRAGGLVKEHPLADYQVERFVSPAEHELHTALMRIADSESLESTIQALLALRPVVDNFFDAVLVMCDDATLQANRLGLLKAVTARFAHLADFTRLSSE